MTHPAHDIYHTILESYFFAYIDRGVEADETPLFVGVLDGKSLSRAIVDEFALPSHDADGLIDMARKEVAL